MDTMVKVLLGGAIGFIAYRFLGGAASGGADDTLYYGAGTDTGVTKVQGRPIRANAPKSDLQWYSPDGPVPVRDYKPIPLSPPQPLPEGYRIPPAESFPPPTGQLRASGSVTPTVQPAPDDSFGSPAIISRYGATSVMP